ncbi:mitofusin-1 [Platysternon megacephalum]|uniref:Mitofusin-1 n=1 Tax=Platysternon megacephalum TaxID=55544 RepID=A0A4D9DZP9_9SAUR|nr:mitofusin-1 [Platysternon megacephalum]
MFFQMKGSCVYPYIPYKNSEAAVMQTTSTHHKPNSSLMSLLGSSPDSWDSGHMAALLGLHPGTPRDWQKMPSLPLCRPLAVFSLCSFPVLYSLYGIAAPPGPFSGLSLQHPGLPVPGLTLLLPGSQASLYIS